MSVFIYLMKGEFDEDLHWPMRENVEIFLVDHEFPCEHFADDIAWQTIKFNEKSDGCFTRVVDGEKSKHGWGKQKFIPHSSMDPKYLKNDCLHFKLSIT